LVVRPRGRCWQRRTGHIVRYNLRRPRARLQLGSALVSRPLSSMAAISLAVTRSYRGAGAQQQGARSPTGVRATRRISGNRPDLLKIRASLNTPNSRCRVTAHQNRSISKRRARDHAKVAATAAAVRTRGPDSADVHDQPVASDQSRRGAGPLEPPSPQHTGNAAGGVGKKLFARIDQRQLVSSATVRRGHHVHLLPPCGSSWLPRTAFFKASKRGSR
jgi:hypothetical protein